MTPEQGGHDVERADARRIVAPMHDDLVRRRRSARDTRAARQIRRERRLRDALDRAERAARRDRIAGVGGDQDLRPLAAHQAALEAFGDGDQERRVARAQHALRRPPRARVTATMSMNDDA